MPQRHLVVLADGLLASYRYRAFADTYQRVPGVEPVEGTAVVVVRAGRIASFAFTTEAATVARRTRQLEAAVAARSRSRRRLRR